MQYAVMVKFKCSLHSTAMLNIGSVAITQQFKDNIWSLGYLFDKQGILP